MKLEKLISSVKLRVGYAESDHKGEVEKGAQIAHTIMIKRISELEELIIRERAQYASHIDHLTGQLRTVAAIFHEHAPKG